MGKKHYMDMMENWHNAPYGYNGEWAQCTIWIIQRMGTMHYLDIMENGHSPPIWILRRMGTIHYMDMMVNGHNALYGYNGT
jgi:hypothetical protein